MKTRPNNASLTSTNPIQDYADRTSCLQGIYRQLFKENRDLDFFHDSRLDSMYLSGHLSTRQMVSELLASEMYRDYILEVNSNYHFVTLCFERVLGRPPEKQEKFEWSSLLATEGLNNFAQKLTNSDEYTSAFGDEIVPMRRSMKLFSSDQNLPALPKEQSILRYTGPGNETQFRTHYQGSILRWEGSLPPAPIRKIAAVLTVAGAIEIVRILWTIALGALTSG